MLEIKTYEVGSYKTNCYLIFDNKTKDTVILDPGEDPDYLINKILELNLQPKIILATHGHFDHLLAAYALQSTFNIPFLINKKDCFLVNNMQKSAEHFLNIKVDPPPLIKHFLLLKPIKLGKNVIKIIETSGHTPGSTSFYIKSKNALFVGDLVFLKGFLGRSDFKYSSYEKMIDSLKKIYKLPKNTTVYPGHGNNFKLKNISFLNI